MLSLNNARRSVAALCVFLLGAVVAACGGGGNIDPILGTPGIGIAPAVTSTSPVAASPAVVDVATNARISAAFSNDIDPASVAGTSFTLACPAGTPVPADVSYDAATRVATLVPAAALPTSTTCVATLTTAIRDTAGFPLAAAFVWSFVTASAADTTPPTVTLTVPAANATAVPNNTAITATFGEDMNPATLSGTTFTLVNSTLGAAVPGVVSYSAASRTAIFTPSTPATLAANSQFTATVTTGARDVAGNGLAANFVWTFTTAALPDTTRPTGTVTTPAPGATAAPSNTAITATFSEDMNPATISGTTVTLVNSTLGTAVPGNVSYSATSRTAIFTPSTPATLALNSQFTATVTTGATDLAGNGLAANFAWTFTTAALPDTVAPSVTAISPQDGSLAVCLTRTVSATFSEPMDAATIGPLTFGVTSAGLPVAGTVLYDAPTRLASFTPSAPAGYPGNTVFTVTVKGGPAGVKDLAGNPLALDRSWGFTTGTQACIAPIDLRSVASFGGFGGAAGMTNQGTNTVIGGNIGSTAVCTAFTGFHDSTDPYTETTLNVGAVNGTIYCAPPAPGTITRLAIAAQASADAQAAYDAMRALPAGGDPGAGQLGGLTLPAAVYTAAGGAFDITLGTLTLDGQGDPNAVWVFQTTAALTVGTPTIPGRVLLINGAQAKNVFWQVGSAARIEDGSVMVGTIIAPAGLTISTADQTQQTTLTGRAISLTASVTMVNTTIVAP